MASKIPMVVARLSKSNAPKVILRQKPLRSMSTLQPKVKATMEKFGIEDATPVFKKNGTFDSLIYQGTMGICVTALGVIGFTIVRLAAKK